MSSEAVTSEPMDKDKHKLLLDTFKSTFGSQSSLSSKKRVLCSTSLAGSFLCSRKPKDLKDRVHENAAHSPRLSRSCGQRLSGSSWRSGRTKPTGTTAGHCVTARTVWAPNPFDNIPASIEHWQSQWHPAHTNSYPSVPHAQRPCWNYRILPHRTEFTQFLWPTDFDLFKCTFGCNGFATSPWMRPALLLPRLLRGWC